MLSQRRLLYRIVLNTISKRNYISKGDFDFTDETPTKDKLVNENNKGVSNENYSTNAPLTNKGTVLLNKNRKIKKGIMSEDEKGQILKELANEEGEKYSDDFAQESSFEYHDKERRGWEKQKRNE